MRRGRVMGVLTGRSCALYSTRRFAPSKPTYVSTHAYLREYSRSGCHRIRSQVCKAAPIPGETKVWQYITLTKNVYLVDCPGVVRSHTVV